MKLPRPAVIAAMAVLLLPSGIDSGWAQCDAPSAANSFIYRFGIDGDLSDADLLELLDTPTSILVDVSATEPGDVAAVRATTETHALYPIAAEHLVEILKDDAVLPQIITDLAVNETICRSGPNDFKQLQRTEFNALFLTFFTEYLIDVHFELNGPEEYGNYWSMYESLDGRLAYLYGSWYFRNVEIGGRQYTYMRHFSLNGMPRRIPGFRAIFTAQAVDTVAATMDAIYNEAVRRYGTTPVASAASPAAIP